MLKSTLTSITLSILLSSSSVFGGNLRKLESTVAEPIDAHQTVWYQVQLPYDVEYELPDGSTKTLSPKCSGAPNLNRSNGRLESTNELFSFLFKPGTNGKLVIYLKGGGICYDPDTCVTASSRGRAAFNREITIPTFSEDITGGFFDEHEDGPYNEHSKVYIQDCTGDMFLGSKDHEYIVTIGRFEQPWTIHHRGLDNVLATFNWLMNYGTKYGVDMPSMTDISLIGSGTAGMGAPYIMPYLAPLVPAAEYSFISDGGIATFSSTFYKTAIFDPAGETVWGFDKNVPTWAGFSSTFFGGLANNPTDLTFRTYLQLSRSYSAAKLGIVSSNQDAEQIKLYETMAAMDGTTLTDAGAQWYTDVNRALSRMRFLANFKSHIDSGSASNIMITEVYHETGASGKTVEEWNDCMLKRDLTCWTFINTAP